MLAKMFQKRKALKIAYLSLVALLLVWAVGSVIFVKGFYESNFARLNQAKYSGYLRYSDVTGYPRSVIKFNSGGNMLTGYIYGEENQKGLVVISHGLGYGAEDYLAQSLYFVDHGWRVFSFDNTGVYQSEGQNQVGLSQSLLDLNAALAYIEKDPALSKLPIMLYGHSWGGYAVAAVLNYDHNIAAVVSIAGFNTPDELMLEDARSEMGFFGYIEYPIMVKYQSWLFGDTAKISAVEGINHTDIPVMIIHGTGDESISYTGASIISHRAEITNPNVVYQTISAENHNGHKSMFKSDAALSYANQLNQEYQKIVEQYNGNIPDEVKAQFYAGIDKFQASQLDINFMDGINNFLESQLP
jgi:pimeloyl-ACP methyl ester carboxylesterase